MDESVLRKLANRSGVVPSSGDSPTVLATALGYETTCKFGDRQVRQDGRKKVQHRQPVGDYLRILTAKRYACDAKSRAAVLADTSLEKRQIV